MPGRSLSAHASHLDPELHPSPRIMYVWGSLEANTFFIKIRLLCVMNIDSP